ncbi:unnamed protein product [Adineta ricciae]|uniref:Serine aminopeptidase S33 domain-containing protein n=1 Tax=Adineta ricciae TaxID=249248 RepID=A0A816AIB0_ADIRI|nr:unnamed protein product [Adineta ricciae]CAF1598008.1 unnamed protein product [Adineta ricciae]
MYSDKLYSTSWTHHEVYAGPNGRKKVRQCLICLMERDDLEERLNEIHCPVLILHGTNDNIYTISLAKKMQQDIKNSHLEIIEGGYHFLSVFNRKEVNQLINDFIINHNKNSK